MGETTDDPEPPQGAGGRTNSKFRIESDGPYTELLNKGSSSVARPPSLLLVDDDQSLAFELIKALGLRGYSISHAATATEGLAKARATVFDLLILDRILGDDDGLSILKTLRHESMRQPVLILSALTGIDDRVIGLNAGGDDYLTKPFSIDELAARIEALLRRSVMSRAMLLQIGPLKMDLIERRVWRSGQLIDLLPREYRLLEYFMRRPGQIVTRKMLLEDIWQYQVAPETRLVDVHIGKLRRKLDGDDPSPMLLSVRNIGFILNL
jgi:two-component system OmpR family response regulator